MEDFKREIDDYFCRFTFGQFVTLILIEVVTLFFVFYLGARYGTDLLGTGGEKTEAVIPGEGPKSVDEIVGAPSVEYTYPEVLTSRDGQKAIRIKPSGVTAEEFERKKAAVREEPVREEPIREEPIREEPVAVPPSSEPSSPENPVVAAAAPETKPVTEDRPTGKFTIQVGSYQSPAEAEAALERWKSKGYSAFLAVGTIPEKGTWYRVRMGGFPTREEAQKFLERFKAKEKASALVVLSSS